MTLETLGRNQTPSSPEKTADQASIILEGEVDIEIEGKHAESVGPGGAPQRKFNVYRTIDQFH